MKTIYKFCFVFYLAVCPILSYSVEECDVALKEGKQEYNSGNYTNAIKLFNNVIEWCGDSYGDVGAWKKKCEEAYSQRLILSASSLKFKSEGGSQTIKVTTGVDYSISAVNNSAFSVSKNGNVINVRCQANPNTSARSGSFTVSNGFKSVKVSLSQSAKVVEPYINVSRVTISSSASGATEYLNIDSNVDWEIQYPKADFFEASKSGTQVKVLVYANKSTTSRSNFFNIRSVDQTKTVKITVNQDAASSITNYSSSSTSNLSVSQSSISASSSGTTVYINVTSNKSWEIEYPSASMYTATRDGSRVKVVINRNSGTARSDFFNIKTTDGSKSIKINISQSGSGGSVYSSYNNYYYKTPYQRFREQNGVFEMYWLGAKGGLASGVELSLYTMSMRIGPVRINPCEFAFGYAFWNESIISYQASVDFFIPWDEEWAVYFGAGPSINLLQPTRTYNYSTRRYQYSSSSIPDVWFKIEAGVHWHWGYLCSSEFFLRYDGIFTLGVSFNLGTGFGRY